MRKAALINFIRYSERRSTQPQLQRPTQPQLQQPTHPQLQRPTQPNQSQSVRFRSDRPRQLELMRSLEGISTQPRSCRGPTLQRPAPRPTPPPKQDVVEFKPYQLKPKREKKEPEHKNYRTNRWAGRIQETQTNEEKVE